MLLNVRTVRLNRASAYRCLFVIIMGSCHNWTLTCFVSSFVCKNKNNLKNTYLATLVRSHTPATPQTSAKETAPSVTRGWLFKEGFRGKDCVTTARSSAQEAIFDLNFHLGVLVLQPYRIYSIKRRPRLNAADGSKITNKRCPRINAAPNQKNAAFVWGL